MFRLDVVMALLMEDQVYSERVADWCIVDDKMRQIWVVTKKICVLVHKGSCIGRNKQASQKYVMLRQRFLVKEKSWNFSEIMPY